MKATTKVLLAASVAGVLLVGCGPKATVDTTMDGTAKVTTDEGTFTTGTDMPKDWPTDVATYPGATVQFSGSATPDNGKLGWALVLVTTDTAQQVKDFYTKQLTDAGWKIIANMESDGTIIMGASKDTRAVSVTAGGTDGQTTITLGVGTQN